LDVVKDDVRVRRKDMHDAVLCDAKEKALFGFKEGDRADSPGKNGGKVV
jgi:hypothetical protein